jgi:methyl-accepting chemotaxis protein
MAAALQVFKDNMLESNRMRAERADAERQAQAQRRTEMSKLADQFEAAVGEIVQTVSSASTELETRLPMLSRNRRGNPATVRHGPAVSGEASINVRSVAAATDEMTASIAEISRQVQESNRIAREAVEPGRAPPMLASTNCRRRRCGSAT